jgi:outer membrane protein insertion porin family
MRQPFVFHRHVEGLLRPFGEYRDEIRDRSVESGIETSVLYRRGSGRTITFRYALTNRWILDAGPGGPIGVGGDLVDVIAGLDTLDLDRRTSSLSLITRWGRGLDLARNRPGWTLQGTAEIAGPAGLSTVQYGKLGVEAGGELPLGRGFTISGWTGAGRLFPYGSSIPAEDGSDRLETYLRLRDATLTAGGPQDVRGWGRELLGPKIPDFRVNEEEGRLRADDYLPLGGLAQWTGSLQVEAPFPLLGRPHGIHVFLDGGRVWTPDDRFLPSTEPLVPGELDDEVRFGTGIGVSFATPVGPIQLDLGYKLNPSPLDLRDPGEVARAIDAGEPLESVREHGIKRWHLHLSMGGIR